MAHKKSNTTQIQIIQVALKMFLEKGFTATSAKAICNELDISTGNLTFYFPTKEHILFELTKEITQFHDKCINTVIKKGYDDLYTYCWEITSQITLCHEFENMRDLYLAMYSHPMTLNYIKDWTAEKNLKILGGRLPDWDINRFRRAENVNCCIERSALTEPCTEVYPLEDKIRLILTCLLKIYDIDKVTREKTINEILATDYMKTGKDLHRQLTKYVESYNQKAIENSKF